MACRALSYKVEICLPELPPPTPTSYLSCKGVSCWLFYSTDAKNKIPGVCLLGQARTQAVTSPSCTAAWGTILLLPFSSPRSLATAFSPNPHPISANYLSLALGLSGPLCCPHWCSQHLTI